MESSNNQEKISEGKSGRGKENRIKGKIGKRKGEELELIWSF